MKKEKQNRIVINKQSWSRTVAVGIEIFVFVAPHNCAAG